MSAMDGIAKRLKEQSNRCTQDPMFCVQARKRTPPVDPRWGDDCEVVWISNDSGEYEEWASDDDLIADLVKEYGADEEILRDEIDGCMDEVSLEGQTFEKVYFGHVWVMVSVHFTEAAADLYCEENAHNLGEHRVYVTSQYRCHEWIAVRAMLMEVSP